MLSEKTETSGASLFEGVAGDRRSNSATEEDSESGILSDSYHMKRVNFIEFNGHVHILWKTKTTLKESCIGWIAVS